MNRVHVKCAFQLLESKANEVKCGITTTAFRVYCCSDALHLLQTERFL